MNHIQRLARDLADAGARVDSARAGIAAFRCHLDGPKFRASEHDHERRDWISVSDVLLWLRAIETELTE